MHLVDTSVWIDFIRGSTGAHVERLRSLIGAQVPVGLSPLIYQEILQGAINEQQFTRFQDYFSCQHFFLPSDPVEASAHAAEIYFSCRRKGITIRSSIDCLIAAVAIEHGLSLLHNDRDFIEIARVVPGLRLVDCSA